MCCIVVITIVSLINFNKYSSTEPSLLGNIQFSSLETQCNGSRELISSPVTSQGHRKCHEIICCVPMLCHDLGARGFTIMQCLLQKESRCKIISGMSHRKLYRQMALNTYDQGHVKILAFSLCSLYRTYIWCTIKNRVTCNIYKLPDFSHGKLSLDKIQNSCHRFFSCFRVW